MWPLYSSKLSFILINIYCNVHTTVLHIHMIHTHSSVQLPLLFLSCLHQLHAAAFLALHRIVSKCACQQQQQPSFNCHFSRTTWVTWYQKDKPFWVLLKQEMIGGQWHQLNHMQVISTSLQCLQCFDAVGRVAGRASGPQKNLSDKVLAWLSVWSKVQMTCIYSS